MDPDEEFQVYGHLGRTANIDWADLDYSQVDTVIAEANGVTYTCVQRNRRFVGKESANGWRRNRGLQKQRWVNTDRTDTYALEQKRRFSLDEHFDLQNVTLGICSDAIVAKWCDTYVGKVKRQREAKGLPKYDDSKLFEAVLVGITKTTPRDELPFGKLFDEPLALHLGLERRTIQTWRQTRGIEGFYDYSERIFVEDARDRACRTTKVKAKRKGTK